MGKTNKKKKTIRALIKDLDKVFSIWIRQRGMDSRGFNTCFTCGARKHWKELQNGHYVSRAHRSLRWDERNCNPQDAACNLFKAGAMDVYAIRLLALYGDNILIDLQREKHKVKKWTRMELESMLEKYKIV